MIYSLKRKKKKGKKNGKVGGIKLMHESAIAASWKKKSIINNDIYGSEINKIVNIAFLWQD